MVVFITLFMTLTTGVQTVSLAAEDPVTRVELRLDGRILATIPEPPWSAKVDFGTLLPHRLEAVGYDAHGREVDRAVQLLNLPRSRAATQIVLESGPEGHARHARLLWQTIEPLELERVELRFDGRPLAVDDPRTPVPLPEYDPERQHHLVAEMIFEGGLRSEAAVGLGGVYGATVSTELTAVAVRPRDDEVAFTPESMAGWFSRDGRALAVRAVEFVDPNQGGADIYVVRNEQAFHTLREVLTPERGGRTQRDSAGGKHDRLRPRDRGFLIHPIADPAVSAEAQSSLFPMSPALQHRGPGGLSWLLTEVRFQDPPRETETLAEATAVAGLKAARGRPRAVVAILHPDSPDTSPVTWDTVRSYLATLQVPLYVLRPAKESGGLDTGGPVRRIRFPLDLGRAIQEIRRDVDSQVVVWLEGIHLPQEITLSEPARRQVEWVR